MVKKDQNFLDTIFEREYESIVDILDSKVIEPSAFENKPINKTMLDLISKNLDQKLYSQEIEVAQPKVKAAYRNLKKLVSELGVADKKEIKRNLNVIQDLSHLMRSCDIYGSLLGPGQIYFGSDPCKEEKYGLSSALSDAKKKNPQDFKLLDAVDGMLKTCSDCPYKILSEIK